LPWRVNSLALAEIARVSEGETACARFEIITLSNQLLEISFKKVLKIEKSGQK
jgi:hypothetical protein